jgi:hypothetical protein
VWRRSLDTRAAAVALALAGLGTSGLGCDKPQCGAPFVPGKTYTATALEPLSRTGTFPSLSPYSHGFPSCQAKDGFQAGSMVKLRATDWIEGRHCQYPLAQIVSMPDAQPLPANEVNRFFSPDGPAAPFFVGGARIRAGSCEMNVAFGLTQALDVTTGGAPPDAFAEPQPGKAPPAVLFRSLWPSAEQPGCEPCEDLFAAKVKVEN